MASNPVNFFRALYQKSPWLVIAAAAHAIVVPILFLTVVGHEQKKEEAPPTTVAVKTEVKKVEEVIQPPEIIDRKAMPKNEESELVSYQEDMYIPSTEDAPDPNQDLTLNIGDPQGMDNLPTGATGGTSVGVGIGGHYSSGVSTFASRRQGAGGKGRRPLGQTQATEESVLEGLRWLLRHQNPDGSWGANTLNEMCCSADNLCWPETLDNDKKPMPRTNHYNEGLTGLSLLAFLGMGAAHDSKVNVVDTQMGKAYKLGDAVKRGLMWLKDRQNEDGSFTPNKAFMYNEALAAMALCEAYGLSGHRLWKEPAQRAIDFIVRAQKLSPSQTKAGPSGDPSAPSTGDVAFAGSWGWRYASRVYIENQKEKGEIDDAEYAYQIHEADTSVTTWCVMALKSAQLAGLNVPKDCMAGALDFIHWVTPEAKLAGERGGTQGFTSGKSDGLVGYLDPAGAGQTVAGPRDYFTYYPETMSALGMCSRAFIEHNPNDPFFESAAKRLVNKPPFDSPDHRSIDYYYWYYGTLALNQFDGPESPRSGSKYWGPWNKEMNKAILDLQDKVDKKMICSRGGWLTLDRWSYAGGPIYTTATNVLTLEVYYRFENAFGGGAGGKAKSKTPKASKEAPKDTTPGDAGDAGDSSGDDKKPK